jgi:hypothetical protein
MSQAGRWFIALPLTVAGILLVLLLAGAALVAYRRHALGKPLLLAAGMTLGGVLAAALTSFLLGLLRAGDFWRAYPLVAYLAIYAVLLLAMASIHARWGRSLDRRSLRAAAWLLVLLLGAMLSFALPGATIFFLIAPAIALVALALTGKATAASAVLAITAVVIQFLMFAELLAFIEMLLIDGPLWAVAPLAALAVLPAVIELDLQPSRPTLALLGTAAAIMCIATLFVPRASAERPLGFSVDYFRDTETNHANWAIATKQAPLPAGFPGRWSKGVLPYNGRPRWIAAAPLLATPAAQVRVLGTSVDGAGRRVRFQISSGGANSLALRFPADAKVVALGLAGAPTALPRRGEPDRAVLRCTGRSCDGLQIDVSMGDGRPVTAEIFATTFGLPPEGRKLQTARPANAIPQYAPDQSITRSEFRF